MRSRSLGWICVLAFVAAAAPALGAQNFSYNCSPDRYASVPLGTQVREFKAPLQASPPTNDSVDVIFESHVPGSWFAQWCQKSTGICYIGNQRIRLVAGVPDTLSIDIMPFGSPTADLGYVDVTIRAAVDPLDVERCTYSLFYGRAIPNVKYSVNCMDNTRYVDPSGDLTDFSAPMKSSWSGNDSLLVQMTSNIPAGWFTQFCQVSTGICYLDEGVLPLNAVRPGHPAGRLLPLLHPRGGFGGLPDPFALQPEHHLLLPLPGLRRKLSGKRAGGCPLDATGLGQAQSFHQRDIVALDDSPLRARPPHHLRGRRPRGPKFPVGRPDHGRGGDSLGWTG